MCWARNNSVYVLFFRIFLCAVAYKIINKTLVLNKYRIFFLSKILSIAQLFSTCQTLESESPMPSPVSRQCFFFPRTVRAYMENMSVQHAMHFYIKGTYLFIFSLFFLCSLSLTLLVVRSFWFFFFFSDFFFAQYFPFDSPNSIAHFSWHVALSFLLMPRSQCTTSAFDKM